MRGMLKNYIWDFVLCVVISASLDFSMCSAFYSTQVYQNPAGIAVMAVIAAVICGVLLATSFSTRSRIIGAIALAVGIVVTLAISASGSGGDVTNDAAGNNFYFAVVAIAVPVLVYVLSRKRVLVIVLLVVGVFACAVIEYLYWYGHWVAFIVFLVGGIAMLVYRTYQKSVLSSDTDALAFTSVTASGVGLALVAVLLGGGVFAVAIAPLNPPNLVVKLITEHYRTQTQEFKGVGNTTSVENLNVYSNKMSDKSTQTNNRSGKQKNKDNNKKTDQGNATTTPVTGTPTSLGTTTDNSSGGGNNGLNMPDWLPYLIVALVIIAIIAIIVSRQFIRRRRYNRMTAGPPEQTAENLYVFFMRSFNRLKIPQPGALTLGEYSKGYQDVFTDFEEKGSGPSFEELTKIYEENAYGGRPITEEQSSLFKQYYKNLYKRIAHYVGHLRYLVKYFFV